MISNLKCLRGRLLATIERRADMMRITRELNDSSDRVLADLGLSRGDIGAVAKGRFGRD